MRSLVTRLRLLAAAALAGGGLLLGLFAACAHDWDVYLPPEGAGADSPGGSHAGGSNPGGGGQGGMVLVGDCPDSLGSAPPLVRVPTPVPADGGTPGVRAECIGVSEVTRGQYELWLDAGPTPEVAALPTPCQTHPGIAPSADWPPGGVRLEGPVAFVDWCDAMMYCVAHGQRLCGAIGGGATPWGSFASAAASEWFNACSDRGGHPFPYGDSLDLTRCRDSSDAGPADVESMSGCVTTTGVYDLSGNVWEWENSCMSGDVDAGCRHRGGGYNNYTASDLGCAANASTARDKGSIVIGFRCCADPIMP